MTRKFWRTPQKLLTLAIFYDKNHGLIFAGMMRLFEKHKPVDLLTLTDELKRKDELELVGGSAYLTELTNYVPTAAHASAYAEMIAQAAVRRRLIKASVTFPNLDMTNRRPRRNY